MLGSFGFIGVLLAFGIIFGFALIAIPWLLGVVGVRPHKPNPAQFLTYECGMDTIGDSHIQFNFRYYVYALLFVIFDVETVFLYPWAVAYNQLQIFGLIEMLIFVCLLVVGLIYAWRKGALEWA